MAKKDTYLLHMLSIYVRSSPLKTFIIRRDEGLALEKKHFAGHIGAVCVTQKPFHISGLGARGNACML